MSFRDWLYVFALGGLIAVLAEPRLSYSQDPNVELLGQVEKPVKRVAVPNEDRSDRSREERGSKEEQPATADPPIAASVPVETAVQPVASDVSAPKGRQECDETCQRDKDDLKAQEGMANAAWAMVAVSGASVLLTLVGVILIWWTLFHTKRAADAAVDMVDEGREATVAAKAAAGEAKRQADFAEDSFKRLERPYLFIRFTATSGLARPPQDEPAVLKYKLVNLGRTPAVVGGISVGLINNPAFPLISTMGIIDQRYDVVPPMGGETVKERSAEVIGAKPNESFAGQNATELILHGIIEYEGPFGAVHTDSFMMRGEAGGKAFRIHGGKKYNWRKTDYPKEPD